jgi:hypothetical protein
LIAGVNAWGELMKAALGVLSTGLKASEMMVASRNVVGARMMIMGDAVRRPADGDYVEISGMLPEKIDAFSKAGAALFSQWTSMVADASEQAQHVGSVLLRGRPLSGRDLSAFTARSLAHGTRMVTRAMETGGLALAPVHLQATANAQRLS